MGLRHSDKYCTLLYFYEILSICGNLLNIDQHIYLQNFRNIQLFKFFLHVVNISVSTASSNYSRRFIM